MRLPYNSIEPAALTSGGARRYEPPCDASQQFAAVGGDEEPHERRLGGDDQGGIDQCVDCAEQGSVKKVPAGQSATDPERAEETEDHSS